MSVISNKLAGQKVGTIGALANSIRVAVKTGGSSIATAAQSNQLVAGLESMDADALQAFQSHLGNVQSSLESIAGEVNFDLKDVGPGLEAAQVIMAASADLPAYARKATHSVATAGAGVALGMSMFGTTASQMDYDAVPALEAFDEAPLADMVGYSTAFNLFAAKQDPFGEALFKTVVVTPELGGIDVAIPRLRVFNRGQHANNGKLIDWNTSSLIDAYADASILADNATDLVPNKVAGGANDANFVPSTAVGAYSVVVSGTSVQTAPLLAGKKIDIIGLSNHATLLGMQVMDINDAVDKGVKLKNVYIQTADGKAAIRVRTAGMPQAQFVKGPEGNYRQMILALDTLISLGADVKAVDGTAVTELALLVSNNYRAVINLQMNGSLNVQTGTLSANGHPLSLEKLVDEDGKEVGTDSGDGATIKAAIEAAVVIGYDIDGKRTNSNRRTVGLRLDSSLQSNRYPINVGSPISVQASHASNNDAADLKALITAARIRNSNNAVSALIGAAEYLEEHVRPFMSDEEIYAVMPGMGRYLIRPFFERKTLDLEASINSIKSQDKAADVAAVLVNALRDVVYRMYQATRYQAACDALTGGAGKTPTLVLATDQVLIRHLMVPGDNRTLGILFQDVKIVQTLDERVKGKIYVTFTRPEEEGVDPLSFGTHAWIPEVVTTVPNVSRDGQQIKEVQVQPRTLHFVNLPALAVIEVQNLSKVLGDKITTPALDTDLSNPFLDGHEYP